MKATPHLPDELVVMIQRQMEPASRLRAAHVSRQWARCAHDEHYWQDAVAEGTSDAMLNMLYPSPLMYPRPLPLVTPLPADLGSWQNVYRAVYSADAAAQQVHQERARHDELDTPSGMEMLCQDIDEVHGYAEWCPWEFVAIGAVMLGAATYAFFPPNLHLPKQSPANALGALLICTGVRALAPLAPPRSAFNAALVIAGGMILASYYVAQVTLCTPVATAQAIWKIPRYVQASAHRRQLAPARAVAAAALGKAQARSYALLNAAEKCIERCMQPPPGSLYS